jgi:hypothetical protein
MIFMCYMGIDIRIGILMIILINIRKIYSTRLYIIWINNLTDLILEEYIVVYMKYLCWDLNDIRLYYVYNMNMNINEAYGNVELPSEIADSF